MVRRIVCFVVVLAMVLALTGCGGGGGLSPGDSLTAGDIDPTPGLDAPLPTEPETGGTESTEAMEDWQQMSGDSLSPAELANQLNLWTQLSMDSPNDAMAQLGLSLVCLAVAGYNAACYLGYNPFESADVQSVTAMAFNEDLRADQLSAQALRTATLRAVPRLPQGTAGVSPSSNGLPTGGELRLYRQTVQNLLLPIVESVQQRLASIADTTPWDQPLGAVPIDGEASRIYPADFQCLAAALQFVRSGLLMVSAVNPDYGSFDWSATLYQQDANQDGILTVAEYAPGSPFANLDKVAWQQAGEAIRNGVYRLRVAVNKRRTGDPTEPLMRALEGENVAEIQGYLADAAAVLDGAVPVTVEWANADWGSGQWVDQGSDLIRFNLRELWDNSPNSFRFLVPRMYLFIDEGHYDLSNGKAIALWFEDMNNMAGTVTYEVQTPDGTFYADMPMTGANHRLQIPAQGGFGGADLWFNWNWRSCWGTYEGVPVTGTASSRWAFSLFSWADIPDKTFTGIFPQPAKVRQLIVGDYDKTVFRYNNFEIVDEPDGVWW